MRGKVFIEKKLSAAFEIVSRITYDQRQSPSALGVDEEQCGDGRYDLDGPIAERGVQSLDRCIANLFEDGRTVKGDNCTMLDTAID